MTKIYGDVAIEMEEIDQLVAQLRVINRSIEDLQSEAEAIKDLLKEQLTRANIQELRGDSYKILYTPVSQSRVDTKLLSATYPEAFRACQKTVSYRRFEVK